MNVGKVATVREQLYGGLGTWQDRIYGDMFCMFIDIGYGGTWKNTERSKDVLIGQLYIENNTCDGKTEQ